MKVCYICHLPKPESDYNYKNKQTKVLFSYCKTCYVVYKREHYKRNWKDYKLKRDERKQIVKINHRKKILKYLDSHPCVDCRETDHVVLEFDHVRGDKKGTISQLVNYCLEWEIIYREIEKCEVRCANCHKRKTAQQFNWYNNVATQNIID